jgi:endonuclease/exonuclease/phosphatase family metal-dependent hydrolase
MHAKSTPLLAFVLVLSLGWLGCGGTDTAVTLADTGTGALVVEPPPVYPAEGVRLATLNAEFLFDGEGDEGGATFPHKGNPELARAHRDRIAEVVRMIDADVVVLQEVENENVMRLMIEESLADLDYAPYFVQGRDTFTGQDVAILSRVPVDTVGRTDERIEVEGGSPYGGSKNVFARMTLGGVPTTIVGLHFLARPTDPDRKPRREAQAEVIRRLVEAEMAAGRAVAVVGDFNDYDDATPDRLGHAPITSVLATIKRAGPSPSDDLRNVSAEVDALDRFTAFWDRNRDDVIGPTEFSAIDHILLSPALYDRLLDVDFVHAYDPRVYTDHFPIVVTLAE